MECTSTRQNQAKSYSNACYECVIFDTIHGTLLLSYCYYYYIITTPSLPKYGFAHTAVFKPESAYLVDKCWCIQVYLQITLHNEKGRSVFCSR